MRIILFLLALLAAGLAEARAQDFQIYTKVYDLSGSKPQIVSRSLSIFYHGRVYDNVPQADEVIVFDPVAREFTVLNAGHRMVTTVTFDEIRRFVKLARNEVELRLKELEGEPDSAARRAALLHAFQLEPVFEPSDNESKQHLLLSSNVVDYEVTYTTPEDPSVVETWVRYADWTKRLNYILYPHVLLPGPRLAVNEMLRQKKVIPVEVTLRADIEPRMHLKAQHKIDWKISSGSMSLINNWDRLLQSKTIKRVTLSKYQQTILGDRKSR
jgi:hypothetical protein